MTDTRAGYLEVRKSFQQSERSNTIVSDALTFRWWRFLCTVSATNILLWMLAVWGLSREANAYQFKQLILSGLFVAACAFRSILPRFDLERLCL